MFWERHVATIKDVARHAGVSHSTVSRTLTNSVPVAAETRERVLAAVKKLNYRPNDIAKALKNKRTRTIGLLLPRIDWTLFPQIADGVENRARQRGYLVILCDVRENPTIERDYVERLKNRSVDGFIMCTYAGNDEILRGLLDECIPTVALLRGVNMPGVDMMLTENFQGARHATQHLIDRGCRRIALVNHHSLVTPFHERRLGYLEALRENGIRPDPRIMIRDVALGSAESRDAVEKMLARGEKIDGMFCTSDSSAVGALQAVVRSGLQVPEEVKMIGFGGNDIISMIMPRLTTMVQPSTIMGERAADRLIDLIEGEVEYGDGGVVERFESQLVQGETT